MSSLLPARNLKLIVASSVIAAIAVLGLQSLVSACDTKKKIIASPRDTQLRKLSAIEQTALPYPSDALPGARDVVSPYGTIRVYEWGPEDGSKVLLIHGISTPCIALSGIARGLVEKGCRVMLFDLWGRGYSDMIDLPLDSRLYTTEILLAITSSPLSWTPGGFSIVGYSLGGGIAVDFASYFPDMVKSVVLLAPGGLIRSYHFSWSSRTLYAGLIPESVLEWLVFRRMGGGKKGAMEKTKTGDQNHPTTHDEMKGNRDPQFESAIIKLDETRPAVTIADVLEWQLNNHEGFIKSFLSSMRYSTIEHGQESWTKLGLRNDKVLVVAGKTDPIIISKELHEDALASVGAENFDFEEIEGGHEFPVSDPQKVVDIISEFWML